MARDFAVRANCPSQTVIELGLLKAALNLHTIRRGQGRTGQGEGGCGDNRDNMFGTVRSVSS